MDFTQSQFISYILALSGTCGFIWFLFSKAEDTLKPKVKKDISTWLKNLDPVVPVENWPGQFAAVFDRIFGEKHLSWRCFRRSSMASIISVIIMSFVWVAIRPNEINPFVRDVNIVVLFAATITVSMLANLLPDYLSLLETKIFIRWMSLSNSLFIVFMLLILDLVITALIFISYYAFVGWVVGLMFIGDVDVTLQKFGVLLLDLIVLKQRNPPKALFFYSTFFTSVWLWIYVLSGLIVKLAQKLNIGLTWFKGKLDINKKPLSSMALVSIMIVTILFMVWPILR